MAESNFFEEQAKYEYLQFVITDVNGIARGKIVNGKFKEKIAKHGCETSNVVCLLGPKCEPPYSVVDIIGKDFPNEMMRPCLDTLTPWPWAGSEGRRVGNVLCDLTMHDGTPDLLDPRQLMKAQLDALMEKHGLIFKSAFEYEFVIFKQDTLEPLGGDYSLYLDVRIWEQHHDLFCDLTDVLKTMGIEISWLESEYAPGQWEFTTEPQNGVHGGDVAFYVKSAVKGFFQKRGYNATFMTKPTVENAGSGLHLNHSLWTMDEAGEKSIMMDKADPHLMSSTARHFLGGILAHAPAITALCCPTLNCYRRISSGSFCPGKIIWGEDDRNALIRVHTAQDNVFFENRLSSGACNPYLAIAATVAAGMDGLDRKLECPEASDRDQAGELPETLAEALDALEKDEQMRCMLGDRFVTCYTKCKRQNEVMKYETAGLTCTEKKMDYERKLYLKNL